MSFTTLLYLFVICFGILTILGVRNQMVFSIRKAFIEDWHLYLTAYECLPSFEAMVFNPIYWDKWTFNQWITYAHQKKYAASHNESNS